MQQRDGKPTSNSIAAFDVRLPGGARWALVFVGVVAFAAFLPSLAGEFVLWDDDTNFLNNPHFRGLTPGHLHWMFTTFLLGPYQPLSWITLGSDYVVWRNGLGSLYSQGVYDIWRANFTAPPGSGAQLAAVPEPGTWVLAIVAAGIVEVRRRRRMQTFQVCGSVVGR